MKKLISMFLAMVCFSSISFAGDKSLWDSFDDIGDTAFKPLKIKTYIDKPSYNQRFFSEMGMFLVDIGFPVIYGAMAIGTTDFHKKMVESQSVISHNQAKVLNNAEIDKILAKVAKTGVSGNQRVILVLESLEHSRTVTYVPVSTTVNGITTTTMNEVTTIDQQINHQSLSNKNAVKFNKNISRPAPVNPQYTHTEKLIVREITRDNIEHALTTLSNNNIKAYSVKVGTVRTSKLKVGGHVLAIYLALDLVHTIRN